MVGNPLQGGVAVNQVSRRGGVPTGDIVLLPGYSGKFPTSFREHFGRRIDADHFGIWESIGQDASEVAGAAAEIVDGAVFEFRDAREEVDAGPKAYVGVAKISLRLPGGHRVVQKS